MKTYTIEVSPQASADLREGLRSRGIAWLRGMDEAISALQTLPLLAGPLPLSEFPPEEAARLGALGVRQKVVGDYLVWFTVDEEALQVAVLRVWPARRDRRAALLLIED